VEVSKPDLTGVCARWEAANRYYAGTNELSTSRGGSSLRGVGPSPASDARYRIVGMTYSAPARMPVGQRAVIVLRRV
jgi:hypothetical protein